MAHMVADLSTSLQYTAAAKTSALEPTAKALDNMYNVFKRDPKLQSILEAPTLTVEDKKQIIAELQKHMGGQDKGDVVKNFLMALAENNRLRLLEPVCEKFAQLMSAYRGEVELVVTSAAVRLKNPVRRQVERSQILTMVSPAAP